MKLIKHLQLGLSLTLLLFLGSCFSKDYGSIHLYIDLDLFDEMPTFTHKGKEATIYSQYQDILTLEIDAEEEDAQIDFSYSMNGKLVSSLAGEASTESEPLHLLAPEEGNITSEYLSYELRPTGDAEEPFFIFELKSDDGGSGGVDCDNGTYNGPEFNIQVDSQCKTAFIYECQGNTQGRDAACKLYYEWESSWQGSGSFPDCPYCP